MLQISYVIILLLCLKHSLTNSVKLYRNLHQNSGYYYYAAFNAPCVGHKDDESPAQNIKLSNSPVLIILYELNLSFYLNILFSLINIITITLRKLASILSAVDLAYKNTEYSRLNCCIVFNNPNKQQAKHM